MSHNRSAAAGITGLAMLAIAALPADPAFADTATGNGVAAEGSVVPPAVFKAIATGFHTLTPILNGLPGVALPPLGLPGLG